MMSGGSNDEREPATSSAGPRQHRARRSSAALPGVAGATSRGDAAYTLDVVGFYADGMPLVIAFVLGLSFLLLLVAFRSIVIPIKAILLNLLSTGAAFGVLVLVFQDGWLAELARLQAAARSRRSCPSSSSRSCSGSRWTTTSSS